MLFWVSCLFVFVSSYLLVSIFSHKCDNRQFTGVYPFLCLILIMFAQVVLTFEILSLFSAIKECSVLSLNLLFLLTSIIIWQKNNRPLYKPNVKDFLLKTQKALRNDNILKILAFGFCFFIVSVVILDAFLPVDGSDALVYHLNRASYWLVQGNLNHFTIADDRNLVMPINSEILYLWNLLYFKTDIGLYYISFIGYLTVVFSVYGILGLFGFSERRKIWTIFVLSSLSSVIAQVSSLETDVLLAGLVLTSITLFLYSLKNNSKIGLYFSALAYALALGTKTPAIIVIPGVLFLLFVFSFQKCKKEFYKPLLRFLFFLILNFVIFSSYNYVLNFIDYGNFLGSESSCSIHAFRGGFKAYIANYIRYLFMMFDFSGFRYNEYIGEYIVNAKLFLFDLLKIPQDLGVQISDNNEINNRFLTVKTGTGILGFLLFLPSVFILSIVPLVKNLNIRCCGLISRNFLNRKIVSLSIFAWMFFINIACLSGAIAYMVYSVRFVTFITLLSAPVIAITYIRRTNLIKFILAFFMLSYFIILSVNLTGRQYSEIIKVMKQSESIVEARETIRCAIFTGFVSRRPMCYLRDYIQEKPKNTKIGVFVGFSDAMYLINMLNLQGYKIDTLLPESAIKYNLSEYDYVIKTDNFLSSSLLLNNTKYTKIDYEVTDNGKTANFATKKDFMCMYGNNDGKFYHESLDNGPVVFSKCYISPEFVEKQNFIKDKLLIFDSEINEFKRNIYIFKNKNLQ